MAMTFKESIISLFKTERSDKQQMKKMLSDESLKVKNFGRNLKKITFNELLISITLLCLLSICILVVGYGAGISLLAVFGTGPASVQIGSLVAIGMCSITLTTLVFCLRSLLQIINKYKANLNDQKVMKKYILKLKESYIKLNADLLSSIQNLEKSNLLKGGNEAITDIAENYENDISNHTETLLTGLKDSNTKKYLRHYMYKDSHISNDLTQVLYIPSTILSVYIYFLEKCDALHFKDISTISLKIAGNL